MSIQLLHFGCDLDRGFAASVSVFVGVQGFDAAVQGVFSAIYGPGLPSLNQPV
jgi:hypothetical protein